MKIISGSAGAFTILTGVLLVLSTPANAEFEICRDGEARAVICFGDERTSVDMHAALELVKYVKMITGVELPVTRESRLSAKSAKNRIVIGMPSSSNLAKKHLGGVLEKFSNAGKGIDVYATKTIEDGDNKLLVLSGVTPIAPLYAVYELLEKYLGCGFFEDGERIPQKTTVTLSRIDSLVEPRWPIRQYLQGCAFGYSCRYWGFDEWKNEIDFIVKKRYNRILMNLGGREIWKRVLKRYGLKTASLTTWDHAQLALVKKILDYARGIGIDTISPGHLEPLSEEFMAMYPDVKTLKLSWVGDPTYNIHPEDPLFVKILSEYVAEYNNEFGTCHLYNLDPYPEIKTGLDEEADNKLRAKLATSVAQAFKTADPKAVWYASGWAFSIPDGHKEFPRVEKLAKSYLTAMPKDMFIVAEIWGEQAFAVMYKRLNYYHGCDWLFGVLHTFGRNKGMHGDVTALVKSFKELSVDPLADRCKGSYINPESLQHNSFFFELAGQLTWNPNTVTLDDYINDYARRRYGEKDAAKMVDVLNTWVDTVYGPRADAPLGVEGVPLYVSNITDNNPSEGIPLEKWYERVAHRKDFFTPLRETVTKMLELAPGQRSNKLFEIDLLAIARQYTSEIFNFHLLYAYKAYLARDAAKLKAHSDAALSLMAARVKLLQACPEETIAYRVRQAGTQPGSETMPPIFVSHLPKNETRTLSHVVRADYTGLGDYGNRDLLELVRDFYGVRMKTYFAAMQKSLAEGSKTNWGKLREVYRGQEAEFWEQETDFTVLKKPAVPLDGVLRKSLPELRKLEKMDL